MKNVEPVEDVLIAALRSHVSLILQRSAGSFLTSEQEIFKPVELHAREAHGEDPAQWSEEDLQMVKNLIRRTEGPGVSPS